MTLEQRETAFILTNFRNPYAPAPPDDPDKPDTPNTPERPALILLGDYRKEKSS